MTQINDLLKPLSLKQSHSEGLEVIASSHTFGDGCVTAQSITCYEEVQVEASSRAAEALALGSW